MKLTIQEIKPTPPPKRIILDLSEGEAGLLYYIAKYYASTAHDTGAAAKRLELQLKEFVGKEAYPYTDYFKQEKQEE